MVNTQTRLWVAGHNLGGYLPDSSPYLTTSWESAKESLLWDLGYANGLADYYAQGLSDDTLKVIEVLFDNNLDDAIEHYKRYVHDETEMETMVNLSQCENAMLELAQMTEPEEWFYSIGYYNYWIQESDRSANEIPEDLEGDELEQFIDELNDGGW